MTAQIEYTIIKITTVIPCSRRQTLLKWLCISKQKNKQTQNCLVIYLFIYLGVLDYLQISRDPPSSSTPVTQRVTHSPDCSITGRKKNHLFIDVNTCFRNLF